MSERPRSRKRAVYLLVAVTMLGVAFGGGVLVGGATRERRPVASRKNEVHVGAQEVKSELAACRSELAARREAQAAMPAAVAPAGEEKDADPESAKVEALQKEVEECKVRETLSNAYLCGTFGEQINLLWIFLETTACKEEGGVEKFLPYSLDKCAEFDEIPDHIDLDGDSLTVQEKYRIVESKWRRMAARRNKNHVNGWIQKVRSDCRKKWLLSEE